ncbi:murein biosynthesis integral membrane protein MurJ [Nocardioides terrisoli]|uniref:murein biosynthesis integral membrane protein MurJ n=1 Tax=Nocardioides terrisoli TaxID=3388267 RepID=UPI00287B9D9F|nr:murein biosynthesis integral membrane protein MurJ [Nocardioides marmorisolisilvae]
MRGPVRARLRPRGGDGGSVLGSSAVMASGTVVSRLSGFVRNGMLMAAIGNGLHGDVFNIANTVPNMLYILLAGGVFNAVLVPQLVRAQKTDADGGEAYTNRVITLAGLFLAGASAVLVVLAPLLMHLFLDGSYFTSVCTDQRESVFAFARWCLPQVFFYGMFVLVGQVLNARGSFGPMMWAPIVNNVVAVAVLATYLGVFGAAPRNATGGYGGGQEALLGLGSTVGIAAQLLVLIPYLRAAGFHFRPRFDFRNSGLGHTLRLGVWTVLFVVVNQIAYAIVVRLASSGTAQAAGAACGGGGTQGTGYTIYSYAFLLVMVPHSIITVSLATAVLPQLSRFAAAGDLRALGRESSATLRTTLSIVLPLMAVVPVVATDLSGLVYGWGASSSTSGRFAPTLSLFALGVVFYTVHYLSLRSFYALEETRRVFHIQCAVALTNIVVALWLTHGAPDREIAPRLVIAYSASYLVGATLSLTQLSRRLGGIDGSRVLRFLVRLAIATGVATVVAWLVMHGLHQVLSGVGKPEVLLRLAVTGGVDVVVVLVLARLMRISELDGLTRTVVGRLRR